jgi:transposase
MALAGVGKLTAMTLVAEIGDIGRFPSARKLCAWPG